ncbi:MAG: hypothetical protein ACJAZX_000264 [Rickettsiales bacterium]|jgi:hypothetical protein
MSKRNMQPLDLSNMPPLDLNQEEETQAPSPSPKTASKKLKVTEEDLSQALYNLTLKVEAPPNSPAKQLSPLNSPEKTRQ